MTDQDSRKAQAGRKQAIKLRKLQRWSVGVIGAAGLLGGCVAVFTENVEAGPVAMMTIGAILFLIAVGGVMPTRLKIGGNEAEFWEEMGAVIEQVVDEVPRDDRAEVLARFATAAPEAIGPSLRAVAYEQMVLQMVREAVDMINSNRQPSDFLQVTVPTRSPQPDARVVDPLGAELAIEIKSYSKPAGPELLGKVLSRAELGVDRPAGNYQTLFVLRSGVTNAAKDVFDRPGSGVITVEVSGPGDNRRLLAAIERGLAVQK